MKYLTPKLINISLPGLNYCYTGSGASGSIASNTLCGSGSGISGDSYCSTGTGANVGVNRGCYTGPSNTSGSFYYGVCNAGTNNNNTVVNGGCYEGSANVGTTCSQGRSNTEVGF
ncbi:MAG: hypothetical protein ABIA04_15325 [Pseudomonadota bacterium]